MKLLALILFTLAITAGIAWSQADKLTIFGLFRIQQMTVLQLPIACSGTTVGTIATVSDSTTTTWGATVSGGGGSNVMVWCNGAAWTVVGK